MSAATIDRLLRDIRTVASSRRRRKLPTALRRSVPIRTFADWNDPIPGFMEIDLVSHCGDVAAGSFAHSLTLTDIASGWTECLPLLFRDSNLIVEAIDGLRRQRRFPPRRHRYRQRRRISQRYTAWLLRDRRHRVHALSAVSQKTIRPGSIKKMAQSSAVRLATTGSKDPGRWRPWLACTAPRVCS